jgi:heme A synthase
MGLSQVHQALANASLLFSLIIAAYGFWRYFRRQGIDASFWGVLAAGEVLYLVQVVVGLLLLAAGLRPARTAVHLLYGAMLAMALPGVYLATRAADTRQEALLYAAAGLFLAGVALRGMSTGVVALPGS